MTTLLHLDDSYLREFSATVTAVDDDGVVLDQTAFYPTGGGQPHDTGTIASGDRFWHVTKVSKRGGDVV
ncbi:MAG: hypothetical protein IT333_03705, partial [Thermomicrobiales bacterium]|nr:hypothetical protein [Thermomicrobiales bacterium]